MDRDFLQRNTVFYGLAMSSHEIAGALDYSDTEAMTRRFDDDEKQNLQIAGFGPRGVTIIKEYGMYSAILGSTKEEANRFKR